MVDESTFGRKPVVVVEIIQPRCSNRFGSAPCTATGAPKCFNTYWTCRDRNNYNTDGSITWRLTRPRDELGWLYEEADANNIKTNGIPVLVSASHTSSRINPGAARTGESPLGRRGTAQIVVSNGIWDDHVGDFYLADRTAPARPAGFWDLFTGRNLFYPGLLAKIYEGYEGQALADMQVRLFDVEQISGPSGNDQYTISCRDPLDRVRGKNAKYPPTSSIDLAANIDASTTAIGVVCLEAELSANFGNTGSTRYIVIGDEIISYTGWTGTEPEFTLSGVVRGVLSSTAAAHDTEDAIQRGAYHVQQRLYDIAQYIIEDHTTVANSYINGTQWATEGQTYLSTLRATTFIPEPVAVEDLLGELCRDGLFSIWWDERSQTIPLLAVRPPKGTPVAWTDDSNLASFNKVTKIDDRMTRVTVYFGVRNWLEPLTEDRNYQNRRVRIDAEVESDNAAGGKIVENVIYSRWTSTFGNALLVEASLLLRYRLPPQYLTVQLDAKDRSIEIGDVVDLTTRYIRDTEGNPIETRWQVIAIEENAPGSKIMVELQSYAFIGKFAIIMENAALDYLAAVLSEDNLLEFPNQFDQWTDTGPEITVTPNTTTAPDGSVTAYTLEKTSGTFERVQTQAAATAGLTYTTSVYLKQGTAAATQIRIYGEVIAGGGLLVLNIDWSDPAATGVSVGDGWYQFSLSVTAIDTEINILIYPSGGTTATGSVYAWGARLEEGPVATGYEEFTLSGCWLADGATNLMPGGDEPYLLQ